MLPPVSRGLAGRSSISVRVGSLHGLVVSLLKDLPLVQNRPWCCKKEEIFIDKIKNTYNVLYCMDDRDRVVKRWRDLGLTCFQVAPGDF